MKKLFTFFLTLLGLNSACSQQPFENTDVAGFAALMKQPNVIVLDVRTPAEYAEGHIENALNIDVNQEGFAEKAAGMLPMGKTLAIYCRSGRRSANAAAILAERGWKAVNLKGGILAWQKEQMAVVTDNYETDTFTTKSGKTIKMYALLHASIRLVVDGMEIEIDPVGKLGNRTTDYAALPKADYILITHEHGDHFDKEAIGLLSGEKTSVITNRRCAEMLGYGEVMSNGDKRTIGGDITIEAVPAYNNTEGRQQFHPKGRDNGYILTYDGMRIYIAGDTEDIPEMAAVHDIDVAFFPCNQPYTMTPEQLIKAALVVKPKVLFPYHYGQTDVSSIPTRLQTEGIDVRIRHYE